RLELAGRHARQVPWLGSLEDATGIAAALAVYIKNVRSVAHQPAGFGNFALRKCRRKRMAHRQVGKLHPPAVEEAVARYEEDVGPLAHESGKGRLDLSAGTGLKDLDLQPHCTSSPFQGSHWTFGACNTGRIRKNCP